MEIQKFAIIVAGGSGTRMGVKIPKQFIEVGGKPILMHSIEKFHHLSPTPKIIVTLPATEIETWKSLCKQHNFTLKHEIIEGGKTRYHSVKNGLNSIYSNNGLVAIHDGVRMFINKEAIENSYKSASESGSGVLYATSKDSLRKLDDNGGNKAVDRSQYCIIQTPQTFQLAPLKAAFELPYKDTFTDDASVFENAGHTIALVKGDYKNIKITTPEDLIIAETFLNS